MVYFFLTVIILHRRVSLFFFLFLSHMFLLVLLSLSVGASRREKAEQSLSCSLKSSRQDTAESCLSSPALVCSHFISLSLYLLSGESADQHRCCEKTTTYTQSDTPSCPLHLYVPRTEWNPSGSLSLHMHPAMSISLISVLNWAEERPSVCLSVDQIKSFQWSPPGSWLCVRSADSGRARQTSGDAPVTPRSLLWWVTSNDVHI